MKTNTLLIDKTNQYIDVTQEWIENATPNSHKLIFDDYFIDDNGIKHPIKNKERVHVAVKNGKEYEVALWLKNTLGGDIHLIPRISDISNTGIKTKTPDFRWNGQKWDLKTPTIKGKFETSIERFVKNKNAKLQAKRFIIDFTNFTNVSDEKIINLAKMTLTNPHRDWIKALMIIKQGRIIKIYLNSI